MQIHYSEQNSQKAEEREIKIDEIMKNYVNQKMEHCLGWQAILEKQLKARVSNHVFLS